MSAIDATLWWFPDPEGTVEELELAESLSDLEDHDTVDQDSVRTLDGTVYTTRFGQHRLVNVTFELFNNLTTHRTIDSLANHLRRGGHVAVAESKAKAVAGFAVTLPFRGGTAIELLGRPWPYNPSAVLVPGDEVVIQSPTPDGFREILTVDTVNGDAYTVTPSFRYRYDGQPWALFRSRGFWPLLRVPPEARNQPLITHDHRITYSITMQLEENPGGLSAFEQLGDGSISTTVVTGFRPTEDDVLTGPRQADGDKSLLLKAL